MAKNLIVINCEIGETRVALIEDGIIAELHMERESREKCLGNVVLGRVTRVLPGMQAAFIDVGLDKAAFLHVEDLIRPDDFESYLSGKKKNDRGDDDTPPPAHEEAPVAEAPAPRGRGRRSQPPPKAPQEAAPRALVEAPVEEAVVDVVAPPPAVDTGVIPAEVPSTELTDDDLELESTPEAQADAAPAAAAEAGEGDEEGEGEGEGEGTEEEGAPKEGAAADGAPREGASPRRRRRRRRGGGGAGANGGGEGEKRAEPAPQQQPKRDDRKKVAPRLDKNTPIRDVVREGQEVLVQISKEPIGSKGARVTSHVSLPGRYVVYMPTVDYVGVSKRIGNDKERHRLREAIEGMRPPTGGIIIRTLAEGLTKKQLKADVGYLVRLWGEIAKKKEGAKAPTNLYEELDIVLKVARDMFGDEVDKIVIDDKHQYDRLVRFVEMFMPERAKDIELYEGDEPIFDGYGLEEEIKRALSRKVPLNSGGYLIIDEAEALTAIDVNTGRFVGKGSKDHEETILKTNLEAVEEIAYQLRFRNLGGLIVLDLIDMERASSREQVRRRLEDLLQKDKAKTSLNRISELGLIEMTRKRTRESLGRATHEPCPYCEGAGRVMSKQTVSYEILRAIRRERASLPGYTILVNAHPDVCAHMKIEERDSLKEAERRTQRRIDLVPQKGYHVEKFDLQGK